MRRVLQVAIAAALLAAAAEPPPTPPLLLKEHLIDVGKGRRMNLVCAGRGSPTVVFEQGTGSRIRDWERVAPAVVQLTRTCFYDRAGYGFSDPAGHDMSMFRVTEDLHNLLARAGIGGPVVLVGHSLGGLYATVYASRFPGAVAGLVLVDPAFADQMAYARSDADVAEFDKLSVAQLKMLDTCRELAAAGQLSLAAPHDCLLPRPAKTATEQRYMNAYLRPAFYTALKREYEAAIPKARTTPLNSIQAHAVEQTLGTIPIRVLTAASPVAFPGVSDAANRAYAANWRAGHEALARLSTDGSHRIVPDTGHFIQYYQPQVVIDAVTDVVTRVRGE